MKQRNGVKNRILAGALAMMMAAAGIVSVTNAVTNPAGIYISGFELKIKTSASGEKSVQALMEVSATGFEKLMDVGMALDYNKEYLEPSDWYTNEPYGEAGVNGAGQDFHGYAALPGVDPVDLNDPLHHLFFRTDENLYGGKYNNGKPIDPLNFLTTNTGDENISAPTNTGTLDASRLQVDAVASKMKFYLMIRGDNDPLLKKAGPQGNVKYTNVTGRSVTNAYYFDNGATSPADNHIVLGTLSFRVSDKVVDATGGITDAGEEVLKQKLQEMADRFNGRHWTGDMTIADGDFLVRESKTGISSSDYTRQIQVATPIVGGKGGYKRYLVETDYRVDITMNSDDVINDVRPVKDEVTINSYQAFTTGKISDLAVAMQNYAESVRATRVSGQQNDMVMYWGDPVNDPPSPIMPDDGPGMTIQKAVWDGTYWVADDATPLYRFKWDNASPAYRLEVSTDGGATYAAVDENATPVYGVGEWFDPRGSFDGVHGHYIIKQYFTYWENTGDGTGPVQLKTFPVPIQVTLHVTPIQVIGAVVDKRQITYRNLLEEVPQNYVRLDLADEARLTLDTPLSGVTPTMPVEWQPDTLDPLTGTAGVGNPNYVSGAAGEVATWPLGAGAISSKTGIGDYTFTDDILSVDIQAKYPWVTTYNDYNVQSVRRIVDLSADQQPPRYVMWAEPYENYSTEEANKIGRLRVTIARQEATWNAVTEEWDWNYVNMASGYQIKLFMPNGQEIQVDAAGNGWFGPETVAANWRRWNGVSNSCYDMYRRTSGWLDESKAQLGSALEFYQFEINPGDLGAGDAFANQREALRRYINLGGWFSAEITDPTGTVADPVQGYSDPRVNIHTMSYVESPSGATETKHFDYTGTRAGLMPFYQNSDLPTFLTLPADETVEVRYDALTGSQPGNMRQFEVTANASGRWPHVAGDHGNTSPAWATPIPGDNTVSPPTTAVPGEIVTYGADLFVRERDYSSFGHVTNPAPAPASSYPPGLQDRQATVKVEVTNQRDDPTPIPTPDPDPSATPAPDPRWGLTLTYQQTGDNVAKYTDGQVRRVTFDSKLEEYTYEQVVTLTLTNVGVKDITGLHIEIPNIGEYGPWFKLVTPPPAVLAAGASATFQISYVENLPEGTYRNIFPTSDTDAVNQPIHIWHDNSGPAHNGAAPETLWDYANGQYHAHEGFEAVLQVTKTRPHKVDVVIHPTEDDNGNETKPMGDGWLVEGVTTTGGADTYSDDFGATVYVRGDKFWVITDPVDEYALITMDVGGTARTMVYYDLADGTRVYLNEYTADGPNSGFAALPDASFAVNTDWPDNPRRLFWGEMPDENITVHVHYYEPLLSKLRLSDLHAYAWDTEDQAVLKNPLEAAAWVDTSPDWPYEQPKMVHRGDGTYDRGTDPAKGVLFDPQLNEYIVMLKPYDSASGPVEQNFCGVSIQLRDLVTHINGIDDPTVWNNEDIYPRVMMTIDDASNTIVCNDYPTAANPDWPTTGSTATGGDPTVHYSSLFNAPVDDTNQTKIAQTTVTINISYDGTALIPPEGYAEREYKVRFVRQMMGEAKHVANPGNSPYGMIENDITIANKAAAKAAFDVNNRFDDAKYTPVQAKGLLTNIYWPEAWEGGVNYDKDETALFVYTGQSFYDPGAKNIYNNAGDFIDGIQVKRELEYVALDTSKTTPIDRFSGASTVTLDLGSVPAVNGVIPGARMTVEGTQYTGIIDSDFTAAQDIRPGIYRLRYSYVDFDGISELYFTRPLIVLSPLGDVDANWAQSGKAVTDTVEALDQESIQARFDVTPLTPLPYELADSVYSQADRLVYQYRIADANNDRNINNIDANMIRRVVELYSSEQLTPFYRPTEYTYPVRP